MREQEQARPKMLDAESAAPKEKGPSKVNDSRLTPKQRAPLQGERAASNMSGPKQKQQMDLARRRQQPKQKQSPYSAEQRPKKEQVISSAAKKTGDARVQNAAANGPRPKEKPKMNAPKTAAKAAGFAGKEAKQILQKGYQATENQRRGFTHEQQNPGDYALDHFENAGRRGAGGIKKYGGRTARGVKNTVAQQKKKLQIKRAVDAKIKKDFARSDGLRSANAVKNVSSASKLKQGAAKKSKRRSAGRAERQGRNLAAQQLQQQAKKASSQLAQRAAKAMAATVKMVVQAVSGALVALAPLLICFAIVGAIAAFIMSPFGIFFSGEDNSAEVTPIRDVVEQLGAEFNQKIEDIKSGQSYDAYVIEYVGSVDGAKINNWIDVLAVFAVKTAAPPDDDEALDVVTIDADRIDLIRGVFFDMNTIDWELVEEEYEDEDGDYTETTLYITVTSKTAWQQADAYAFDDEQREFLEELLSGEFDDMFRELLGIGSGGNLSAEEIQAILDSLPDGVGRQIVELCLSRMGDPYSQELAGTGRYTDCSHLVQWVYAQVGASVPRTAAEQARFVVDGGLEISRSELQPGDLIFWSYDANGRYMDVGHVGVYVGDGYVVHASSVEMQVWYELIFHEGSIVLYGRIA